MNSLVIISSSEDRTTSPRKALAMHERIPVSQLIDIDGSGHMSPAEAPEQVNAALLEFLGRQ